jgi:ribosomal protein L30/L7E
LDINAYPTHTTLVIINSTLYETRFQPTQVSETIKPSSNTREHLSSTEIVASNTHYKITLHHSAIVLPQQYKATLVALGIIIYHPHTPDISAKILWVKELVQVENVPASRVRTKTEQRWERRPQPGLKIVGLGGLRHTNDYHICEYMLKFLKQYLPYQSYTFFQSC